MEKSLAFVHYMLGLIDASPDGLDETKTSLAKEKLKNVFIHEIDPSFGFSKTEFEEANKVHSGKNDDLLLDNVNSLPDLPEYMNNDMNNELVRC